MGIDREDAARPGAAVESLPQSLRDAIDLNNEIAGRETGRAKRFLLSEQQASLNEKEREKERAFSALLRALQDPEYAKLYYEVENKLERAETAAEKALDRLGRESVIAADELRGIEDEAAQLPDGRRVYRSEKDGKLYTEDGADVTDQEQSVTGLKSDSPSLERRNRAKDRIDDLDRRRQEVEKYQREFLNPIRERMDDAHNPHTKDDLRELSEEFEKAPPADIEAEYAAERRSASAPVKKSAADEYISEFELGAPDMNEHFQTAKAGEPHASPETPLPANTPKLS